MTCTVSCERVRVSEQAAWRATVLHKTGRAAWNWKDGAIRSSLSLASLHHWALSIEMNGDAILKEQAGCVYCICILCFRSKAQAVLTSSTFNNALSALCVNFRPCLELAMSTQFCFQKEYRVGDPALSLLHLDMWTSPVTQGPKHRVKSLTDSLSELILILLFMDVYHW